MENSKEFPVIKRIAAVHDICGYGKCSLGTALPILSSAGFEVCPVPTGIYSKQTNFANPVILDSSEILDDYIKSWIDEGVQIDAVYSGFLSNKSQVAAIMQLYVDYPKALRMVDPVMGDGGKIYTTYTPELCDAMKRLVPVADILKPNVTEACYLLEQDYHMPTDAEARQMITDFKTLGSKNVVLTGVVNGDKISNYCIDEQENIDVDTQDYLPIQLHGSGDVFASVLLARFMQGQNLHEATRFAAEFTAKAIELSTHQPGYKERGISFEPLLGMI